MKRHQHLLERIIERDNLRLAFLRALRGKRHRPDARLFALDFDANLARLGGEEKQLRRPVFQTGRTGRPGLENRATKTRNHFSSR